MGRADFYKEGDWNVACAECGRKRKASSMKKHWKGYYVCPEHFEPRHPQDFVRAPVRETSPAFVQASGADVQILRCTPEGMTAIADVGVAGCAIADFVYPEYVFTDYVQWDGGAAIWDGSYSEPWS